MLFLYRPTDTYRCSCCKMIPGTAIVVPVVVVPVMVTGV